MEAQHELWVLDVINWLNNNDIPAGELEIPERLALAAGVTRGLRNELLLRSRQLADERAAYEKLSHALEDRDMLLRTVMGQLRALTAQRDECQAQSNRDLMARRAAFAPPTTEGVPIEIPQAPDRPY